MITIQGTYTKVTTALAVPNIYNIDPFDLYGNLLSEMTIEVDSTLAQPAIFLPAIADLNNNWQIKINIIATTGSVNPVFIGVANPPDKIGAAFDVSLVSDGASIEINPIDFSNWYGVVSDSSLLIPAYKVYTALLTQSGGSSVVDVSSGTLTVGMTYTIDVYGNGDDFTNVGAPNNNNGTLFVATGTTPNNWSNGTNLQYNTGAPVATVLENTIGNIYFQYISAGIYNINVPNIAEQKQVVFSPSKAFKESTGEFYIDLANNSIDGEITIVTTDGNARVNNLINDFPIEIRVYN